MIGWCLGLFNLQMKLLAPSFRLAQTGMLSIRVNMNQQMKETSFSLSTSSPLPFK